MSFVDDSMTFISSDEFKEDVRRTYRALYDAGVISLSVDNIPYTEDFERLYVRVCGRFKVTRNEVFRVLMNRRKRGEVRAPKR